MLWFFYSVFHKSFYILEWRVKVNTPKYKWVQAFHAKSLLFLIYIISSWAVFYAKIFSKSMLSKEQAESKN